MPHLGNFKKYIPYMILYRNVENYPNYIVSSLFGTMIIYCAIQGYFRRETWYQSPFIKGAGVKKIKKNDLFPDLREKVLFLNYKKVFLRQGNSFRGYNFS